MQKYKKGINDNKRVVNSNFIQTFYCTYNRFLTTRTFIFSGYLNSIEKFLKSGIQNSFFRGPNIDFMKNMKKKTYFLFEMIQAIRLLTAMLNVFILIILSLQ